MALGRPLTDLDEVLGVGVEDRLCSGDLTFDIVSRTSISASAARYKRAYETRFGFGSGYYDISQNPDYCGGACRSEDHLFTLTTNSAHVWSTSKCRFLSGNELGAAQGLPTHSAIAAAVGSTVVDVNGYKPSVLGRMVGNGMATVCVSAMLTWVAACVTTSRGTPPRSLGGVGPFASIGNAHIGRDNRPSHATRDTLFSPCLNAFAADLNNADVGPPDAVLDASTSHATFDLSRSPCLGASATAVDNAGVASLHLFPTLSGASSEHNADLDDDDQTDEVWTALGRLGDAFCGEGFAVDLLLSVEIARGTDVAKPGTFSIAAYH